MTVLLEPTVVTLRQKARSFWNVDRDTPCWLRTTCRTDRGLHLWGDERACTDTRAEDFRFDPKCTRYHSNTFSEIHCASQESLFEHQLSPRRPPRRSSQALCCWSWTRGLSGDVRGAKALEELALLPGNICCVFGRERCRSGQF